MGKAKETEDSLRIPLPPPPAQLEFPRKQLKRLLAARRALDKSRPRAHMVRLKSSVIREDSAMPARTPEECDTISVDAINNGIWKRP